jgi:hypothetical protein
MNWIASLARIVGAAIPFGGVAVQISAEIDGHRVQERLRRLEDPISAIHPDVREVSELIYGALGSSDTSSIELSDEQLTRYSRVLAMLDAQGLINGSHAVGKSFAAGFRLTNPSYVLYMAALFEEPKAMEQLVQRVDSSQRGTWLKGPDLAAEYSLPLQVVKSVFQLYEQRGLGLMSKELGTVNYVCQA